MGNFKFKSKHLKRLLALVPPLRWNALEDGPSNVERRKEFEDAQSTIRALANYAKTKAMHAVAQ